MTEQLPQAMAFPLAYAQALDAAERLNIRALGIKGPVTTAFGYNDRRTSSDADVMVDESRVLEYIDELNRLGWQQRPHWRVPSIFPPHSLTLFHEHWPVDIDVHVTFPGCFGAHDTVFEALWSRHDRISIAGVSCRVTDAVGTAFIALLHALRHPNSAKQRAIHDRVVAAFEARDSFVDDVRELARLAIEAGATEALGDDLKNWRVEDLPETNEHNAKLWKLYTETHEAGSVAGWLVQLRKTPLHRRPALLKRALVPSKSDLKTDLKTAALSPKQRVKFVLSRIRDSVKQLRTARAALKRHGSVRQLHLYAQEPERGTN